MQYITVLYNNLIDKQMGNSCGLKSSNKKMMTAVSEPIRYNTLDQSRKLQIQQKMNKGLNKSEIDET